MWSFCHSLWPSLLKNSHRESLISWAELELLFPICCLSLTIPPGAGEEGQSSLYRGPFPELVISQLCKANVARTQRTTFSGDVRIGARYISKRWTNIPNEFSEVLLALESLKSFNKIKNLNFYNVYYFLIIGIRIDLGWNSYWFAIDNT